MHEDRPDDSTPPLTPPALPPVANVARPITHGQTEAAVPIAMPVDFPLAQTAPLRFPELDLRRRSALLDIGAVAAALFAGQMLLGQFAEFLIDWRPDLGPFLFNTLLGVMALTAVGFAMYFRDHTPSSIGLNRDNPVKLVLFGMAAMPICYFAVFLSAMCYVTFVGADLQSIARERQPLLDMAPAPTVATFLLFGVFTGFHEDVLFRGFVLTRVTALCKSRVAAIILSSIVFGFAHIYQGPLGVVQTTALGLVFCGLVTLTRSLWPAVIAHALFNSISLSLMPLLRPWLESLMKEAGHGPLG